VFVGGYRYVGLARTVYIYTVYGRIFNETPAKNVVYINLVMANPIDMGREREVGLAGMWVWAQDLMWVCACASAYACMSTVWVCAMSNVHARVLLRVCQPFGCVHARVLTCVCQPFGCVHARVLTRVLTRVCQPRYAVVMFCISPGHTCVHLAPAYTLHTRSNAYLCIPRSCVHLAHTHKVQCIPVYTSHLCTPRTHTRFNAYLCTPRTCVHLTHTQGPMHTCVQLAPVYTSHTRSNAIAIRSCNCNKICLKI